MDADTLKQKLNEQHKPSEQVIQYNQKQHQKKIAMTVAIVAVVMILLLGTWSIFTTPKKESGPPKACFKSGECLELIFANTPEEQEIGYSNYTTYPEGKAMLFTFPDPVQQTMWMKDMDFSIDIIWIDTRGRIGHIEKEVPPCESIHCAIYEPPMLAKYVLEVPPGFSMENNLYDGNLIEFENMPR